MAQRQHPQAHPEKAASSGDETSETRPNVPDEPLLRPKVKGRKRLGPPWNPINAVYGDSIAPDFPRID